MSILDKQTRGDLVKLVIFIVVTTLATGVLVVLIGNLTFQCTRDYKAVFSDATGVVKGDDIRIAGVKVGSVKSVEIVDRTRALVVLQRRQELDRDQELHGDHPLPQPRRPALHLADPGGGRPRPAAGGLHDPDDRTQPALDLTVLFNGFKPLFAALSPADINKLSAEVISVFQGEGGNFNALLQNTASMTNTLADRDQVIGSLIDNLNSVLGTLAGRDKQLSSLIVEFKRFMAGLVKDKDAILGSLDSVSHLAEQTSDLVVGSGPPSSRTSRACARWPPTSTRAAPSSTARCRSCRSS